MTAYLDYVSHVIAAAIICTGITGAFLGLSYVGAWQVRWIFRHFSWWVAFNYFVHALAQARGDKDTWAEWKRRKAAGWTFEVHFVPPKEHK